MRIRFLASLMAVASVVALLSLAPLVAAGPTSLASFVAVAEASGGGAQAPTTAVATWDPPRTPDGQPDIQGFWGQRNNITTYSLLEGEADRAEHISITGQAAAIGKPVKTPDGKIPYQPWAAEKTRFLYEQHLHPSKAEYLDPVTRGFLEGVPRINLQGQFQIIQRPGSVLILHDYGHTYRVIPLDQRSHLGQDIKLWMGDSRGHWEGNTLVVDVTNNNDQTWFDIVGTFHSDALHIVERWTFVSRDKIDYEVTIEDPKVYTRPWKMAWNYGRNPQDEQWENAVWEGNKATTVILGNRETEKK